VAVIGVAPSCVNARRGLANEQVDVQGTHSTSSPSPSTAEVRIDAESIIANLRAATLQIASLLRGAGVYE